MQEAKTSKSLFYKQSYFELGIVRKSFMTMQQVNENLVLLETLDILHNWCGKIQQELELG